MATARRASRKPLPQLARRVLSELRSELDRFTQPRFGRKFSATDVLTRTKARSIDALWGDLTVARRWPISQAPSATEYATCCPGDDRRILDAADCALRHDVDLLGSGRRNLGETIDWLRDFRTGDRWPLGYFRSIDYVNRGRLSDIKNVWELSRMQWLLPCGQAFALTGDERYAECTRDVIDQWIEANPYAWSVNWSVTMEPALRLICWTALLRLCGTSKAWSDATFRAKFVCALYTHAIFTERYIERSDVNGNHFTADAAALVVAGALFADSSDGRRWLALGLADVEREIVKQVHPDGVDFEASSSYHLLVAELFLAASVAAEAVGRKTSVQYRERLAGMARFTAAYMRPNSTAPLWGDHDDARVLPLGGTSIRDHRYLMGLIGVHLADEELLALSWGSRAQVCWWFGPAAAARLPASGAAATSTAFPDGGVYVIQNSSDHVFIDCGPVGLAGRGGHGHNDSLSFEAFLDGVPLVTEGGCFTYTADFESRMRDRSTRSHNTPCVDGQEINRFIGPDQLWTLIPDAQPVAVSFAVDHRRARFSGAHSGFWRLPGRVEVRRDIEYDFSTRDLTISDVISGRGVHLVEVPLHLDPHAVVEAKTDNSLLVIAGGRQFALQWEGSAWEVNHCSGRVAPSYGVAQHGPVIQWRANAVLPLALRIRISCRGPVGNS